MNFSDRVKMIDHAKVLGVVCSLVVLLFMVFFTDNCLADFNKTLQLSKNYSVKITEFASKQTVVFQLINNGKAIKTITVPNSSTDQRLVKKLNLNGVGNLDYFIIAYDLTSTFGAETDIIVWDNGTVWDMCKAPFISGSPEDRNADGIYEMIDTYPEEKCYFFDNGTFYPIKLATLHSEIYEILPDYYASIQKSFQLPTSKVLYAGLAKLTANEQKVAFAVYSNPQQDDSLRVKVKVNGKMYVVDCQGFKAKDIKIDNIFLLNLLGTKNNQLVIRYSTSGSQATSSSPQSYLSISSWMSNNFVTVFGHALSQNVPLPYEFTDKPKAKITVDGQDEKRYVYVWDGSKFVRQ